MKTQLPDIIYPNTSTLQLTEGSTEDFITNLKVVANTLASSAGLYKTMSVLYLAPENEAFYQQYSNTLLSGPSRDKYLNYLDSYSLLMKCCSNNPSAKAYIKTTVENIARLSAEGQAMLENSVRQNQSGPCTIL
ncbi:MAG: hypothetical protein ACHP6I_00760 [Rickettsiales bacterium]